MTISAPRSDEQMDRFNEECAVFGVFAPDDSAHLLTALGLHALQ